MEFRLLSNSIMARIFLVFAFSFSIPCASKAGPGSLSLSWAPSPAPNIAGYILRYGVTSGQYTGNVITGTNTSTTVSGLIPGLTYYFAVAAYNSLGAESKNSNQITNTIPLQILAQPLSQTLVIGAIDVLSVDVVSPVPVTFQWFFDGQAIEGATNSILVLPRISAANAGFYTVVASSSAGNVTSQTAVVGVLDSAIVPQSSVRPVPSGVYNGLFCQTNATGSTVTTEASSGFLSNCALGQRGTYSGCLLLNGQTFSFSGVMSATGEINTVINRSFVGLSNLNLTLFTDKVMGPGRLTGVVSNMSTANPWVALITAEMATNAFSPFGEMSFTSPSPPGQIPTSLGCQLIITPTGVATLIGQLGDGSLISQTVSIGIDGSFPIYQSLYNNTGLLTGWVSLAGGTPIGNLKWIQTSNPGFTNNVSFGTGPGLSTSIFQPISLPR